MTQSMVVIIPDKIALARSEVQYPQHAVLLRDGKPLVLQIHQHRLIFNHGKAAPLPGQNILFILGAHHIGRHNSTVKLLRRAGIQRGGVFGHIGDRVVWIAGGPNNNQHVGGNVHGDGARGKVGAGRHQKIAPLVGSEQIRRLRGHSKMRGRAKNRPPEDGDRAPDGRVQIYIIHTRIAGNGVNEGEIRGTDNDALRNGKGSRAGDGLRAARIKIHHRKIAKIPQQDTRIVDHHREPARARIKRFRDLLKTTLAPHTRDGRRRAGGRRVQPGPRFKLVLIRANFRAGRRLHRFRAIRAITVLLEGQQQILHIQAIHVLRNSLPAQRRAARAGLAAKARRFFIGATRVGIGQGAGHGGFFGLRLASAAGVERGHRGGRLFEGLLYPKGVDEPENSLGGGLEKLGRGFGSIVGGEFFVAGGIGFPGGQR
eukprot:Sdes_comp19585_c0_seq1m11287